MAYRELKYTSSKTASNKLVPHRLYNYKIKLKTKYKLLYSLLYRHFKKELQAAKKYITKNLDKGFIAFS